jgi:hypothetical protein
MRKTHQYKSGRPAAKSGRIRDLRKTVDAACTLFWARRSVHGSFSFARPAPINTFKPLEERLAQYQQSMVTLI